MKIPLEDTKLMHNQDKVINELESTTGVETICRRTKFPASKRTNFEEHRAYSHV